MTAHQRRPGFRLPWSSEGDTGGETPAAGDAAQGSPDEMGAHAAAESAGAAEPAEQAPATENMPDKPESDTVTSTAAESAADAGSATADASPAEAASGFLGDLISAMRRVAEEARDSTLSDLRSRAEEAANERQSKADARRDELRGRAENDIAGVGDWAKAEAERIKAEAEQRVAARRAELERQLASEDSRYETDAEAIRGRVSAYEREVDAFFQQLSAITDPAAFAAAAKRMPPPPSLDGSAAAPALHAVPDQASGAADVQAGEPQAEQANQGSQPAQAGSAEGADASRAVESERGTEASSRDTQTTNGSTPASPVAGAQGEATSATELQQVDAGRGAAERETLAEPVATEIVVKGLGSFGAITGFRQQLAGVEGVDAVGLSLGTSGEFVFRATHRPSLDMAAAITELEGEGVEIEPRAEGGLRVTLGRPR